MIFKFIFLVNVIFIFFYIFLYFFTCFKKILSSKYRNNEILSTIVILFLIFMFYTIPINIIQKFSWAVVIVLSISLLYIIKRTIKVVRVVYYKNEFL